MDDDDGTTVTTTATMECGRSRCAQTDTRRPEMSDEQIRRARLVMSDEQIRGTLYYTFVADLKCPDRSEWYGDNGAIAKAMRAYPKAFEFKQIDEIFSCIDVCIRSGIRYRSFSRRQTDDALAGRIQSLAEELRCANERLQQLIEASRTANRRRRPQRRQRRRRI